MKSEQCVAADPGEEAKRNARVYPSRAYFFVLLSRGKVQMVGYNGPGTEDAIGIVRTHFGVYRTLVFSKKEMTPCQALADLVLLPGFVPIDLPIRAFDYYYEQIVHRSHEPTFCAVAAQFEYWLANLAERAMAKKRLRKR